MVTNATPVATSGSWTAYRSSAVTTKMLATAANATTRPMLVTSLDYRRKRGSDQVAQGWFVGGWFSNSRKSM
jgi:hypothetical protein